MQHYEILTSVLMPSEFERCAGDSPFCLGMVEYHCCDIEMEKHSSDKEAFQSDNPAKRMKLSLSKNQQKKQNVLSPTSRFNNTVSADEIASSSKGFIPTNTSRSTGWAYRVFQQWLEQRNRRTEEKYPDDLLMREEVYDCDTISGCLQRFVSEARRVDGTPYPPKTLYQILCGLLRYSKEHQTDPPNFLDRKDTRFKKLHGTCDVVFRALHQSGIGSKKTSAKVILDEDEEKLWQAGVLNTTTPIGLQRAVFYYIGKACCLRGGEEQRGLKPSQFSRLYDPDRYEYTENGSKKQDWWILSTWN